MDAMKKLRARIDELDATIMTALEERFDLSEEIGGYKKKHELPLADSEREKEIYAKMNVYRHKDALIEVYRTILEQSRLLQK